MSLETEILTLLSRPGWEYQEVREGPFTFDRAFRSFRGGRLCAHAHKKTTGPLFWHPHIMPIAVVVCGPSLYSVRFGYVDPRDAPPDGWALDDQEHIGRIVHEVGRASATSGLVYALAPDAWHAVQTAGPCATITLFHPEAEAMAAELSGPRTDLSPFRSLILRCVDRAVLEGRKPR